MVRKRERQTDGGGRVYSGKEKPFNALLDEMKTPELEDYDVFQRSKASFFSSIFYNFIPRYFFQFSFAYFSIW